MLFNKVDREAQRRQYKRVIVDDMIFRIDDNRYPVKDISFDGILVTGVPDWIVVGQIVHFTLEFELSPKDWVVPAIGQVKRHDPALGMALKYKTGRKDWRSLLHAYFLDRKHKILSDLRDR